ncbi:GNAT family N-acetyltransferase [Amycolatopsis sp. NPDC024027]|uniref:GNAT family N-acetyltransferase n=1 Tax=Amycolatopsis sp. NPDC024027 TaxID=3154327 RepID=UPI0034077343
MTEPSVRSADSADLDSFATALGDRAFFVDRFERQRKGLGELFLAWLDGQPAGAVYLWREDAEELLIRCYLPCVALLTHLEVLPEMRNRGVGQALVGAVEQHLRDRSHHRVALAVRTDNHDAARLYGRLGYRDWAHGEVTCLSWTTSPDGRQVREPERCRILVKDLALMPPAPRTEFRTIGTLQRFNP